MPWTKEDDEMLEQMSYTHPICPVCKDTGFVLGEACSNCHGGQ